MGGPGGLLVMDAEMGLEISWSYIDVGCCFLVTLGKGIDSKYEIAKFIAQRLEAMPLQVWHQPTTIFSFSAPLF